MKYLLADSGSTKIDWIEFWSGGEAPSFRTQGINPDIQPADEVRLSLMKGFREQGYEGKPAEVFFYGASLSNQANCDVVRVILEEMFPGVVAHVEHDMLAAARATCLHHPGITCILGTGSNSCLYDGENIIGELGGHGYLFGDEGSGADMGKALMRNIFNKDFRPEIGTAVEAWKGLKLVQIRKEVHQSDRPNVYLAGFSRFVSDHLTQFPELREMVKNRFKAFFELTVLRYPGHEKLPVNFVGSIAEVFGEILDEALRECNLQKGRHVHAPAAELVRYHRQALGI